MGNIVFGRTTDFVLDHAPCEVLLNLVPKNYPAGGLGGTIGASRRPLTAERRRLPRPCPPRAGADLAIVIETER